MESNRASPSIALPLLALSSFFFALAVSDPRITEAGLYCNYSTEIVTSPSFNAVMREILDSVADRRWGNYSLTSPPPGMYGLTQCHGDLTETECRLCFIESSIRIARCLPNFGRLYLDGCFLRYGTYDFYNETVDPTHDTLKCSSNLTVPAERVAELSDRVDRVLRKVSTSAVRNKGFAVAGEDGVGGVAGVYALAQCWSTLDAGGCRVCLENATSMARSCAPGEEARAMNAGCFLRYSTTKFYNVPVSGVNNATRVLTWEERLHIIIGIAEGLAYLHGGCGVKIIHRDIKANNILLDENLTAKIADFGLARCIAPDKSHLSTGIAGTIGYMAPEYLVRGLLTEKADVYAFGVLVLEILTGRKNSVYTRGSSSVLQSVRLLVPTIRKNLDRHLLSWPHHTRII